MKIPYRPIFIGLLAIVLVALFKNKTKEDLTATADISQELSQLSLNKGAEEKTVDFSTCDPDKGFTVTSGLGLNKLKIIGPQEDNCIVETTFETEGGYYINDCTIPLSLGQLTFSGGSFDEISQYCKIKSTGNGLLELD